MTRGDRSLGNDVPVLPSEVLGLVVALERDHRHRQLRARPNMAEHLIRRALLSSDRTTYFYLRLSELWRRLCFRGAAC